jgi:hypothetical protein
MNLAAREEPQMIDNPVYQSWAACKSLSSVTSRNEIEMAGRVTVQTMRIRLIEVTPQFASIEVETTSEEGVERHTERVPAKVRAGTVYMPADFRGTVTLVGQEQIEIAGVTYECQVFAYDGKRRPQADSPTMKISGKIWRCEKVPGMTAKSENKIDIPVPGRTTMIVTEIDVK